MTRTLLALLVGLFLAGNARAECVGSPTTLVTLLGAISAVEDAWRALDVDQAIFSNQEMEAALGCLAEPLPPGTAARYHRTLGLAKVAGRETQRATEAFGAARLVEPAYQFPESLVPAGNRVLDLYAAFPVEALRMEPADLPSAGQLRFDGRPGDERRRNLPVIFQYVDAGGKVVLTTYLWPNDDMPAYPGHRPGTAARVTGGAPPPVTPTPPASREPLPRERPAVSGRRLAGGGLALVGVGLAAGGIAEYLALGDATDACDAQVSDCAGWYDDTVMPLWGVSLGMMGLGAAAMGTGGVLLVATDGGAVVGWAGTFR